MWSEKLIMVLFIPNIYQVFVNYVRSYYVKLILIPPVNIMQVWFVNCELCLVDLVYFLLLMLILFIDLSFVIHFKGFICYERTTKSDLQIINLTFALVLYHELIWWVFLSNTHRRFDCRVDVLGISKVYLFCSDDFLNEDNWPSSEVSNSFCCKCIMVLSCHVIFIFICLNDLQYFQCNILYVIYQTACDSILVLFNSF